MMKTAATATAAPYLFTDANRSSLTPVCIGRFIWPQTANGSDELGFPLSLSDDGGCESFADTFFFRTCIGICVGVVARVGGAVNAHRQHVE